MKSKTPRRGAGMVSVVAMTLVVAEVVLVFTSWLLSATAAGGVRSLLSAEGIRFFFGNFVGFLQTPLLIMLLLLSMAVGSLRQSGLLRSSMGNARQRRALLLVAFVVLLFVVVVVLLTALPHAVLLSATGKLWPSAFSRALVPIVAFMMIIVSAVYGFAVRQFMSLTQFWQSLTDGLAAACPLLLLYVLGAQLYASVRFVFF